MPMRSKIFVDHWPFVILLVLYASLSAWLIISLPGFTAPNEGLHYEYVALMRLTGKLPDTATSRRPDERHQPPLYYGVAALLSLPFDKLPLDGDFASNPFYISTHRGNLNAKLRVNPDTIPVLYVMRFTSLLFGILGVAAVYATASLSFSRSAALLIGALTAFHPMYLFMSAAANNDLAVTAMGASVLLYTTYLIRTARRPFDFLWWGVLASLSLLTKGDALLLLAILPVACLAFWLRMRRASYALLGSFWGILGLLPLWGAWLVYNSQHGPDTLGLERSVPLERLLKLRPADLVSFLPHLERIWRSFWLDWSPGEYGYAPGWVYLLALFGLISLVAGWLLAKRKKPCLSLLPWMHLVWIAVVSGSYLGVKVLMSREAGFLVPEGRWLLPIVPSLAWIAGAGWSLWEPRVPSRLRHLPAVAATAGILALTLWYIPILYPRARVVDSVPDTDSSAHPNFLYDGQLELLGVKAGNLTAGEQSTINLYWRVPSQVKKDYIVSAQLLVPTSGMWDKLDIQNSMPGNGLSPTKDWSAGAVYEDQAVFVPQGTFNGPTRAVVGIWVLGDSLSSVSISQNGAPLQIPVAQEVTVRPSTLPELDRSEMLSSPASFGASMDLMGVRLTAGVTTTRVTLLWQATADIDRDYTVFVHILDSSGRPVAQDDSYPDASRSPTHLWRSGDVIYDMHEVAALAPEGGILDIGVYDSRSGQRLRGLHNGMSLTDDVYRLENLRLR